MILRYDLHLTKIFRIELRLRLRLRSHSDIYIRNLAATCLAHITMHHDGEHFQTLKVSTRPLKVDV
jgi:hypothetical protein